MQTAQPVPSYVDPSKVFKFDIYNDDLIVDDPHEGFLKLRKAAPGVFWTPANGGHWVVMESNVIADIVRKPEIFSTSQVTIPKLENAPRMIPETLDPPEHMQYRQVMMDLFSPKSIHKLEQRVIQRALEMINAVKAQGHCEFVSAVAAPLPVKVFMEFAGLPLDRYEDFRDLINNFFEAHDQESHQAYAKQIYMEMTKVILDKQANPTDDVISHLTQVDFQGRKFNLEELQSIGFMLFLAGLDTVTNGMTFGIRHLARDHELQQLLRENPEKIPAAVEELLRRYTFTGVPRIVKQDVDIGGVSMKSGDMVFNILSLVGLDEKLNPEPLKIDLERKNPKHFAFSYGNHTCLGRHLGRMELRILYEIWLREIPMFSIDESKKVGPTRGGTVISMPQLWLKW